MVQNIVRGISFSLELCTLGFGSFNLTKMDRASPLPCLGNPLRPLTKVRKGCHRLPTAAKRSKFQIGGTWTDFRTDNAKFRDWPAALFYLKKTRQWADGSVEKYDSGCGCWLWIDNEFNNRERSRGTLQVSCLKDLNPLISAINAINEINAVPGINLVLI